MRAPTVTGTVLALSLALAGCGSPSPSSAFFSPPPPLADSALPAGDTERAQTVYVSPVSDGCSYGAITGVAAVADGLILSEDTCSPAAGDEDAPDSYYRLVQLTAEGGTEELPLPDGVGHTDGQHGSLVLTESGAAVLLPQPGVGAAS